MHGHMNVKLNPNVQNRMHNSPWGLKSLWRSIACNFLSDLPSLEHGRPDSSTDRILTAYTHSNPPFLEAVSPAAGRRAVLWCYGHI